MGIEALQQLLEEEQKACAQPRPTILVIDDENGVRRALARLLRHDFVVQTAASGHEALALLDTAVSCVILDIQMPEQNGFEVCTEIQKHYPLVPIVFHSGYQNFKDFLTIINDHHPFGFLLKGCRVSQLRTTIANATAHYQQILDSAQTPARSASKMSQSSR